MEPRLIVEPDTEKGLEWLVITEAAFNNGIGELIAVDM